MLTVNVIFLRDFVDHIIDGPYSAFGIRSKKSGLLEHMGDLVAFAEHILHM